MNKKSIIETISSILVFLFLYTALSKFTDLKTFTFSLSQSPILKEFPAPAAYLIPSAEVMIVLFLIFPKTRYLGLWSSMLLLTLFTVYLIAMISFYKHLPCGCGGVISKLSWTQHVPFNIFFILLSLTAIRLHKKSENISSTKKVATV